MDALDVLQTSLEKLPQSRLALFCVTCTQSITPIVHDLGTQELANLWSRCLDLLWSIPHADNSKPAVELFSQIRVRPEADCSDSHYKEYYLMRAISLMDYTCSAVQGEDVVQNSKWVSNGLFSISADIDFAVPDASRIRVVKGRGLLRDAQIAFQESALLCLRQKSPSPDSVHLVTSLREKAQGFGTILHGLLPAYSVSQGWDRQNTQETNVSISDD